MLDSIASVQAPRPKQTPVPRWRKISTWLLVLMPVYAMIIFVAGFIYFLPAAINNVGINGSLPAHAIGSVNGMLVPDQEGAFLQMSSDIKDPLMLLQTFNDRSVQPPVSEMAQVDGTKLRYVLCRQAKTDLPDRYLVFRIADGKPDVPVQVVAVQIPYARVSAIALSLPDGKPWPSGAYMLNFPSSGLFNEPLYYFFAVK